MSDMQAAVKAKLDGTQASVIAMMTGMTAAEINELGGTP